MVPDLKFLPNFTGNLLYSATMMTLLFLLVLVAMIALLRGNTRLSYYAFFIGLATSIYWYTYHATSTLSVAL